MDLRQLRLFADVADVGSLTKVAVMRGGVQSALSKQLAALEAEIGGKLFYRTGRGVVPSELGQAILPRVRSLLREADQLRDESRASSGLPFGRVTIGIQSSAARPLATQLFVAARERYPGIQLRIVEGFSGHIEEWLASGRADIGILNRYGGDKSRRDDALLKVALCLVGPRGDALTARRSVRFASLAGEPLVLPGLPNGLRVTMDEAAARGGIRLDVAVEVDSLVIIKDVVASGGVRTILPLHAVAAEVARGELQAAPLVDPPLARSLVIATTTQRPLTRAGREVARLVRGLVGELVGKGEWRGDVISPGRPPRPARRGAAGRSPRARASRDT
ncbi:MAG TPA: LysR family transcriptional regulator [Usitatibacter sp.]|nr:LysR family transcriptional regulator [Usitatibacter sp.]